MKEEKQRLIRTLADAYQSGWAKWLFGGLCCQLLLPFLLKTALLYIEKHSLDVLTLFLADSAGILGGAAFVLAAARSARPDKRFPFRLLFSGILPLLAVFYGRELLLSLLQTYLAPMFQNLWSVWIPGCFDQCDRFCIDVYAFFFMWWKRLQVKRERKVCLFQPSSPQ